MYKECEYDDKNYYLGVSIYFKACYLLLYAESSVYVLKRLFDLSLQT